MALVIPTDDQEPYELSPATPPAFSLEEIHRTIGGYMETIELRNGLWLVANEDGLRLELQPNGFATWLVRHWARRTLVYPAYVVGVCLVATTEELGGRE